MSFELRETWSNAGGSAPEHWNFVRFEDLLADQKSIAVGVMYPGEHDASGFPLIKISDVKNGAVVGEPEFRISETVNYEYRRTSLRGDELLITLVGNPGDCAIVDKSMVGWNAARALAVVRLKDPSLRRWLRYVLLSNAAKNLIDARLNTTVQKTLNLKDVRSLPVPLAPPRDREAIVRIASTIENKANVNHRINQTLEQIAQALFKSWFVDFEPVKAKIAAKQRWLAMQPGNEPASPICYASELTPETPQNDLETAMNLAAMEAISGKDEAQLTRLQFEQPEQYAELRATADLFPSAMQESELGEIPERWSAGTLSDISFFPNNRISREDLSSDNYISTENMLENRRGVCNASSLPSSASVPSFDSKQILVSNIRPYFKKIWFSSKSGGRSPDVLGFECKHHNASEFLYNALYQDQFFDYMMLTSKGVKMPRGDKKAIMQFALAVPPVELMQNFSDRVGSLYTLITSNNQESILLATTRDTLLPKLLSGELSVSDAESRVAEVEESADV